MRTIITNLDGEKELVNLSEPFYSGKITKIEHDYSKTLIEALWIGPRSGRMFAQIYRYSAPAGWLTVEVDLPTFLNYCDQVGIDAPDSIEALEI